MFLNNTRSKIDALEFGGSPRPYLGMSSIGFHCIRSNWISFHWCDVSKHTARTERIFSLGHLFEEMIIKQMKDSGLDVYKIIDGKRHEHYGKPDEDQEEYIGFEKYVKGHSDGRVKGLVEDPEIEHLLEVKTMKEVYFKELCKVGIKKGHSTYFGQAQRYMLATGLKWALFIVINKNTSHIYTERVKFDEKYANELKRKEISIVMADVVPENPYPKTFYKCDLCFSRNVCKGDIKVSMNCRTCKFCDIIGGGKFACSYKDDSELTTEMQRKGCNKYKIGWGLDEI